ncbi:hypothetical protein [Sigmofec virus UA08Rod_6125]|uniref:Uncharacterized protein n=1 Tax=Sigmofec virus UA08Rod_6125 TaxID=2929454 RepID=A0A976N0S2_9VIRU|nr:hypothetical protein [Sigmofec virus UA08Rod_6125]
MYLNFFYNKNIQKGEKTVIELITTGCSIVITATTTIIAIVKAKKENKKSKLVKLAKIVQQIPGLIAEAEQTLGSGTGKAKLRYVLNAIQIECLKAQIEYKEDEIKVEIENILSTPQKKEI